MGTTVPEAGNGAVGHGSGVVSGPRSVGSESSAGSDLPEIKEEGEGKSDEKVSQNGQQAEPANGSVPKDKLAGGVAPAFSVTPPTISLHKRRSSSMTGSHSHLPHSPPSITLPSATLTTHASGNISSPAETPTPHLDDKTWFHVGLPRLLNDMSAVFQAQLAGKEDHAGLQLLRSTRGRSTDDYFTGIGGVEVAPHPETPKELAERYAQESEDEKERRHRRNESLTGKLAMEPVAEEDETTPVLDEDIDRNPTPGELAIQEKMDSMGLREASLGAGSDITAVTERSEPYSS